MTSPASRLLGQAAAPAAVDGDAAPHAGRCARSAAAGPVARRRRLAHPARAGRTPAGLAGATLVSDAGARLAARVAGASQVAFVAGKAR